MLNNSPETSCVWFTAALQGTPEPQWLNALAALPSWQPEVGMHLVIVSPHPDDETFGAGGLIASCTHTHQITVLCVTDGEASHPQWEGLRSIRNAELEQALFTLAGRAIPVVHLGLPDGKVRDYVDKLRAVIFGQIDDGKVILVAPFERDGHPDHDAVGAICREVGQVNRIPVVRYPIWTWHHSRPEDVIGDRWCRFELGESARTAKGRAMRCFKSQIGLHFGTTTVGHHVLQYFERPFETFIV